jgi:carbamoyl-phosphate synthase large subunit
VYEGQPNIVDSIINGEIALVINTTIGKQATRDSYSIRRTALERGVPYCTTIPGAKATVLAIKKLKENPVLSVKALQDYYLEMRDC